MKTLVNESLEDFLAEMEKGKGCCKDCKDCKCDCDKDCKDCKCGCKDCK